MKNFLFNYRTALLFAALAIFTAPVSVSAQATQTKQVGPKKAPEAMIYTLYKQHNEKNSPFWQKKSKARVAAYFTRATTELIWKDATRKNHNEPGVVDDGDPLYNSQDIQSQDFVVQTGEISGNNATVNVNAGGLTELRKLKFLMVIENGQWKIEDIDYGEAGTLVKWLKAGN